MGLADRGYDGFSATHYGPSMARMPRRMQHENMVHLYPAAVRSRLLRSLVPGLVRLPATPLYASFGFVYRATRFAFSLGYVTPRDFAIYSGHYRPKRPPGRRGSKDA
jgi:hypothetical protein